MTSRGSLQYHKHLISLYWEVNMEANMIQNIYFNINYGNNYYCYIFYLASVFFYIFSRLLGHECLRWFTSTKSRFIVFWKISGDTILKLFLIDPGNTYRTRKLNEKFYLLGHYPKQTKLVDWFNLLFQCSIIMFFIIYEYAKPFLPFFSGYEKSHSPYFRAR